MTPIEAIRQFLDCLEERPHRTKLADTVKEMRRIVREADKQISAGSGTLPDPKPKPYEE